MANIIFTTYQAYPDFSQSDQLVAAALSQQGHTVLPVAWERDLAVFQAADLVILRVHWNYHHHPEAFIAWLDGLTAWGGALLQQPGLGTLESRQKLLVGFASPRGSDARVASVADRPDTYGYL